MAEGWKAQSPCLSGGNAVSDISYCLGSSGCSVSDVSGDTSLFFGDTPWQQAPQYAPINEDPFAGQARYVPLQTIGRGEKADMPKSHKPPVRVSRAREGVRPLRGIALSKRPLRHKRARAASAHLGPSPPFG